MLNIEISKDINDFLLGKIVATEFETKLYQNQNLENEIGSNLYFELISIDYSNSESKYKVKNLVDNLIDLASVHKQEIIETLISIINKQGDIDMHLKKLNSYAEIGYYFLSENDLIANYREQGKSILINFDNTNKSEYWNIVSIHDQNFISWTKRIIEKIEKNIIIFTNEKLVNQFGQVTHIYKEK